MAEENEPTVADDIEFNHQISLASYVAGLKAEAAEAIRTKDKERLAAVKAELATVLGETAVQPPKEQA